MDNLKMSLNKILFTTLLVVSGGVAISSFLVFFIVAKGPQIISIPFLWWSLNFSFPSWSGLVLILIAGIVSGFILVKNSGFLFPAILAGFFIGLFFIILFFSLEVVGYFLLIGINRFILENLPELNGREIYISLLFLVFLTTLSGFIGGILARLYQKFFKRNKNAKI